MFTIQRVRRSRRRGASSRRGAALSLPRPVQRVKWSVNNLSAIDVSTSMPRVLDELLPENTDASSSTALIRFAIKTALVPLSPMLAQVMAPDKIQFGSYLLERKYDGERLLSVIYSNTANASFYTRNLKLVHFRHAIRLTENTKNCVFDGEMVYLDDDGSVVPICDTGLRQNLRSRYLIFDIQYMNGQPVHFKPLSERKSLLRSCLVDTDHVRVVPYEEVSDLDTVMRRFRHVVDSERGEGLVLKDPRDAYIPSCRKWIKLKPLHIDECRDEFDLYAHRLLDDRNGIPNILECGYYDDEDEGGQFHLVCRVSSGIEAATRNIMRMLLTSDGHFKARTIVTIIADKITQNRSLRHPIFKCLRLDMERVVVDPRLTGAQACD